MIEKLPRERGNEVKMSCGAKWIALSRGKRENFASLAFFRLRRALLSPLSCGLVSSSFLIVEMGKWPCCIFRARFSFVRPTAWGEISRPKVRRFGNFPLFERRE
jgi:hypothetical protein